VTRRAVAAVGLLLSMPPAHGAGGPVAEGAPRTRHDTHVSMTRMVVEDSAITARVRMFRDDLEHALARFHGSDSASIASNPRLDSLVAPYLARTLVLTANGTRLAGRVLQVGRDRDEGNWEVTWVLLRYPVTAPVRQLEVQNGIMFEMFPAQQNMVQALFLPGGERQALYFVRGSGPQHFTVREPPSH